MSFQDRSPEAPLLLIFEDVESSHLASSPCSLLLVSIETGEYVIPDISGRELRCILCQEGSPTLSCTHDVMRAHLESHWDKDRTGYATSISERNSLLRASNQYLRLDLAMIECHSRMLLFYFSVAAHPAEIKNVLEHGNLPPCTRTPALQLAVEHKREVDGRVAEQTAEQAAKRQRKDDQAAEREAKRQQRELEQEAKRQQKKDEQEAKRQQKKDEQEAKRQQRELEQEAKRQQRELEQEAKLQRKLEREAKRQQKRDERKLSKENYQQLERKWAIDRKINAEKKAARRAARLKKQKDMTHQRKKEIKVERRKLRADEFQRKLDDFARNPITPTPANIRTGDSRVLFVNARQMNLSKAIECINKRTIDGYGPAIVAIADFTHSKSDATFDGWKWVTTELYSSATVRIVGRLAVFWRPPPSHDHISCFDIAEHTITLTVRSPASTRQLQIVFAYLPPRDALRDKPAIGELASALRRCCHPPIVVGDLNASLGDLVGDEKACPRRFHLTPLLTEYQFEIFNNRIPGAPIPTFSRRSINKPTTPGHEARILDYLFVAPGAVDAVSGFHLVDTYDVYESETTTLIRSDHRALEFDLTIPTLS